MRFHREGFTIILITLIIIAVLNISLLFFFPQPGVFHILFWIFCAVMLTLVLRFFRVPGRGLNEHEDEILSGADGVVVAIEETQEPEFFGDRRIQVSVFMSIHNVHINWSPVAGIIRYYKYHEGAYLIAHHPKSSTENERTTIVVEDRKGRRILMRQIAGMGGDVARFVSPKVARRLQAKSGKAR